MQFSLFSPDKPWELLEGGLLRCALQMVQSSMNLATAVLGT